MVIIGSNDFRSCSRTGEWRHLGGNLIDLSGNNNVIFGTDETRILGRASCIEQWTDFCEYVEGSRWGCLSVVEHKQDPDVQEARERDLVRSNNCGLVVRVVFSEVPH